MSSHAQYCLKQKPNIQKTKIMASSPITSRQIDGETVADFIFLGFKITVDGDCSHEIKRRLLLGRKVMTNLDSILKSRDITLPTKVHLVKAMVFPVVMYGCENWTIRKAECQRIDAFELWCWRRLLRIPWTLTLIRTDLPRAQAGATALPSQPPRHPLVRREVRADSPRNLGGKVSESQGRRWLRRRQHPSRRAEAWEGRSGPPAAPERGRGLPGTHGSDETSLVPDLRSPLPQVSSEGAGLRASLSPLSECGPQPGGRKSPWGPSPRPPAPPRGLPASLTQWT